MSLSGDANEISNALSQAILSALPGSKVEVILGSPGHYSLRVHSQLFAEKSLLAKQRLVFSAITELMAGDQAPVHAIDKLETLLPD